jgi:hypothetical protein
MSLDWPPITVGAFTARELAPAELWSQATGDATAETIVEETSWEGAAAASGSARAMLEGWLARGAWIVGLYRDDALIGLFDVGRFATWAEATGERPDGEGDLLAERVELRAELVHMTLWFAVRPAERGSVPGPVFQQLSDAFLGHLWDRGIRRMVTVHLHHLAAGRAHAGNVERFGWRTLQRRGLTETKVKRLERRP